MAETKTTSADLSTRLAAIMRRHIYCDATGLSPAVASVFLHGFEAAAEEVSATIAAPTEAARGLAVTEEIAGHLNYLRCLAESCEDTNFKQHRVGADFRHAVARLAALSRTSPPETVGGGDAFPQKRWDSAFADDPNGWGQVSRSARNATGLSQDQLADAYNDWIWSLPEDKQNPHQFKAFLAGATFGAFSAPLAEPIFTDTIHAVLCAAYGTKTVSLGKVAEVRDALGGRAAYTPREQTGIGRTFPNYPHQPGLKYQHTFAFEGGSLTIYAQDDRDGSGYFAFKDDDLEQEDTESGAVIRSVRVDRSELIELRDKLLEAFPSPAKSGEAPNVVLMQSGWSSDLVHDVRPRPQGLSGRWCARCGVGETTCSLEGMKCQPIFASQRPYAALSSAPPAEETWQAIDENTPRNRLLLLAHEHAVLTGWWDQEACGWVDGCANSYEELHTYPVTHWREPPLPPAPAGESK